MLYEKHTLLVAKKMHDEGGCISDNKIELHLFALSAQKGAVHISAPLVLCLINID